MSLPDGEYDISLSNSVKDSLALRYSFIPESMDQSLPMQLFQMDNESILSVKSVDSDDIIFEGTTQSHKEDSYYLSFDGKTAHISRLNKSLRLNKSRNAEKLKLKMNSWQERLNNGEVENSLKPLEKNTIREKLSVPTEKSISRSAPSIKETKSLASNIPLKPPVPRSGKRREKETSVFMVSKKNQRDRSPMKRDDASKVKVDTSPNKNTPAKKDILSPFHRDNSPASKRPPSANKYPNSELSSLNNTPNIDQEPIISASDFDDLEDFDDFPVITFDDEDQEPTKAQNVPSSKAVAPKQVKPVNGSSSTKPPRSEPVKKSPAFTNDSNRKKQVSEPIKTPLKTPEPKSAKKNSIIDIEDDFKDLEDQLAEVLEEGKQNPTKSSGNIIDVDDSDESDYDNYEFSKITIDHGQGPSSAKPVLNHAFNRAPNSNPISLRNLAGNEDSSSEEE